MGRYDTPEWKELVAIQNELDTTDILTITGFMNEEQLLQHLVVQRSRLTSK